jgi:hypothetical protein
MIEAFSPLAKGGSRFEQSQGSGQACRLWRCFTGKGWTLRGIKVMTSLKNLFSANPGLTYVSDTGDARAAYSAGLWGHAGFSRPEWNLVGFSTMKRGSAAGASRWHARTI